MKSNENNRNLYKFWGRALASRVLFAWIPWLRYVGLNGSLARGEASSNSDIDMMAITAPGHIYTVRFLMLSIIALVGIKRTQNKVAGRLCVNCFQTSDNLDIRPHNEKVARSHKNMVRLVDDTSPPVIARRHNRGRSNPSKNEIAPHFAIALRGKSGYLAMTQQRKGFSRRPFFSKNIDRTSQNDIGDGAYHARIMRENEWMNKYQISISEHQREFNKQVRPLGGPWSIIKKIFEIVLWPVGNITEKILKHIQLKKIARHPLTAQNRDRIITTDKELMFHPRKTRIYADGKIHADERR